MPLPMLTSALVKPQTLGGMSYDPTKLNPAQPKGLAAALAQAPQAIKQVFAQNPQASSALAKALLANAYQGDIRSPVELIGKLAQVFSGNRLQARQEAAEAEAASAAAAAKPPTIAEFFDAETGQPYKAQWNSTTKTWDRVGGAAKPEGGKVTPYTDLGKIYADVQAGILTPEQGAAEAQRLTAGKAADGFTLGGGQARYDATGKLIATGPAEPPKPPEPFTLGEGQTRYGPDGRPLASVPRLEPTKAPEPFTLGEGQARYGPDGKLIAAQPKPQAPEKPPTDVQLYQFDMDQRRAAGQPEVPFGQWDADRRKSGAASTNVTVGGGRFGTIPSGYELVEGPEGATMRAIPGSPADLEAKAKVAQTQTRDATKDTSANVVVQDIDRALAGIKANPMLTTGPGAALTQGLAGMPAYDVKALTDTVRANTGFDKLQAMREASPTGGALGQVSEKENALLQATIGNLELSQGAKQVEDNLKRVKNIYLDIIHGPGHGPPREQLSFEAGPQGGAASGSKPDPLGIR